MTTIRISTESQRFQIAASKDEGRYNINGVHFNSKHVVATNGHYLVMKRKAEGEPDNVNLKLSKLKAKGKNEFHAIGTGKFASDSGAIAETLDSEFPNYETVLNNVKTQNTIRVGINPKYLWEIAQAFGVDKLAHAFLTLEIPIPNNGESVSEGITVAADESAVAVLMPGNTITEPCNVLKAIRA
jgi:DNA polymerase III sliding clamp (beta) subunit (PCNA family)